MAEKTYPTVEDLEASLSSDARIRLERAREQGSQIEVAKGIDGQFHLVVEDAPLRPDGQARRERPDVSVPSAQGKNDSEGPVSFFQEGSTPEDNMTPAELIQNGWTKVDTTNNTFIIGRSQSVRFTILPREGRPIQSLSREHAMIAYNDLQAGYTVINQSEHGDSFVIYKGERLSNNRITGGSQIVLTDSRGKEVLRFGVQFRKEGKDLYIREIPLDTFTIWRKNVPRTN